MNLKLKSLVAAVVLAASVPAHATMSTGNNGSFVLSLLNNTDKISASFDLGINYLDFNQDPSVGSIASLINRNWNLASGDYASAWSTFWAAVTNSANVSWTITATDSSGTGVGGKGFISTFSGAGTITNSQIATATGNQDSFMSNGNILGNNATTHGAWTATTGTPYAVNNYTNNKFWGGGPLVTGALDTAMSVVQVSLSSSTQLSQATQTMFGNGAQFLLNSNGALTFTTAVPEADTSAMFLAGLGLMGFIARRRTQA